MSIADKAKEVVYGDRERTYGSPEKNLIVVAELWSAYTGASIRAYDVTMMMALLKIARLKNLPAHEDSMVDLIGYTLLHDEIVNSKNEPKQDIS